MPSDRHISGTSQPSGMHWYAARTCCGRELAVRDRLRGRGGDVAYYIPTTMRRNCRGKLREHPLIRCLVFIRATKKEACALKTEESLPVNYLFDYANHTMLTVPDKQMEDFMRIMDCSLTGGGLVNRPLALGDRVRVTKGPLKGVEGNVLELQGEYYVVVGISALLYARAKIPRAWLEKTED